MLLRKSFYNSTEVVLVKTNLQFLHSNDGDNHRSDKCFLEIILNLVTDRIDDSEKYKVAFKVVMEKWLYLCW